MKIFSSLFGLIILVFVLCFALSNQQSETLALWPFSGVLQVSLSFIALIPLALGLILGSALGWFYSLKHRLHARRLTKDLEGLKERIEDLQKTSILSESPLSRKKSFWRRRR